VEMPERVAAHFKGVPSLEQDSSAGNDKLCRATLPARNFS
jgi:hypothetical protein